jgi:hypothetical protein
MTALILKLKARHRSNPEIAFQVGCRERHAYNFLPENRGAKVKCESCEKNIATTRKQWVLGEPNQKTRSVRWRNFCSAACVMSWVSSFIAKLEEIHKLEGE